LELAKRCAKEGYDLLVAATNLRSRRWRLPFVDDRTQGEAVQADLATTEGVDRLYAAVKGRQAMPSWQMPGAVSATRS